MKNYTTSISFDNFPTEFKFEAQPKILIIGSNDDSRISIFNNVIKSIPTIDSTKFMNMGESIEDGPIFTCSDPHYQYVFVPEFNDKIFPRSDQFYKCLSSYICPVIATANYLNEYIPYSSRTMWDYIFLLDRKSMEMYDRVFNNNFLMNIIVAETEIDMINVDRDKYMAMIDNCKNSILAVYNDKFVVVI